MAKRKTSPIAAAAYVVFFLPLLTAEKKDPFVRFHVRQGLLLLVLALALQGVLSLWAYWGLPLVFVFRGLIRAVLLALLVVGVLNAMRGEEKDLPVVGKYAPKI